ncbi:EAL domain, c-di-GMP-specific phosphodiesterase class I (or its enzymatically inactive variant) [Paraburkholderia lycopersici]|uniref:EAL domain, c-di-GMP-specific phosphodiesterase class I (Or its enzymatically inactive variant) n=2 Tax=Paraburkholderia lycopersici TaxID=416944 RepID=A0A1G7BGB4_9BURK|nr:EAL domain, c-di-GMP-specific phosphodiesterase class I (or its enzymatically inactive variant) [Paraburkholderia lycopersici]
MVDLMRCVRFDAIVLYPDLPGGLCFECLMSLSRVGGQVRVWLVGDATSPLVKCAAIVAASSGLSVSLRGNENGGVAKGASVIDIGRTTAKKSRNSTQVLEEHTVRKAIAQGRIVPYFQPIVNCRSRSAHSLELLARWSGALDTIGPDRFMPVITHLNLDRSLLEALLRGAQAGIVSAFVEAGASLSINVSARLMLSEDLPVCLANALGRYRPESIVIEITESDSINDYEFTELISRTAILRSKGYRFSIDDFGQGHSNLLRLASLPVSEVKIDRFLVAQAREFEDARHIIGLCVDLAKRLGMCSVLEGVETARDFAFAQTVGVDAVQGWFIGCPVPADQLANVNCGLPVQELR